MTETAFLRSYNPITQEVFGPNIAVDTSSKIEDKLNLATKAFETFRNTSVADRAAFLRAIADGIEAYGDPLVQTVMSESGLPEGRVKGERGRTCGQLRMFADHIENGDYVDAVIDHADLERKPIPKADIRRMLVPIGPIVVFTASNFPLAFSTAGGDTASALAAGNPVIVKAHESHPATNKIVSEIIEEAADKTGMPKGVFQSIYANNYQTGAYLVQHPNIKGGAFTGSHKGGLALLSLANERKDPIPFFAEMGSVNPITILPERLQSESAVIAKQIAFSVNLGTGQFCTNPGLLFVIEDENTASFKEDLAEAFQGLKCTVMLNKGIHSNYNSLLYSMQSSPELDFIGTKDGAEGHQATPAIATTSGAHFLTNKNLRNEVFGPFTVLVCCKDKPELLDCLESLDGQLTGTLMATEEELRQNADVISSIQSKVGRLIFNGLPTGVEVNHAMHHGGPVPSTTDSRFTSVGSAAINRFIRPICYQDWPDEFLPDALKESNPMNIWRTIDGKIMR